MILQTALNTQLFRPMPATCFSLGSLLEEVAMYCGGKTHAGVGENKANPDEEALMFYLLNHAFSLIRQKYGPADTLSSEDEAITRIYLQTANAATVRLLYYVLLIISRESRHVRNLSTVTAALSEEALAACSTLVSEFRSKGSSGVVDHLKRPEAFNIMHPVTKYVEFLREVFYQGSFSGGYGGKPWGNIADCLFRLVSGVTTPEIFLDTAFTLAHNNGPMFNKGMLYTNYSTELYTILDVQRAGLIPDYVAEKTSSVGSGVSPRVASAYALCSSLFKECGDFLGYVDWFAVVGLGALKNHIEKGKAQVASHGPSPYAMAHPNKFKKSGDGFLACLSGLDDLESPGVVPQGASSAQSPATVVPSGSITLFGSVFTPTGVRNVAAA